MVGGVFVKLNYKTIGEFNSLIVDRQVNEKEQDGRYIMCAGKCNKNGWTLVFKARNFEEAEELSKKQRYIA
ncbi:MAG: hypothetical protein ACRC7N_15145 [Clostridium sp.]